MKRFISSLLVLMLLPILPLNAAAAELPALPESLQEWMEAIQRQYFASDGTALKPVIPVAGWPVYWGGDWSYQYPPDWTVLSGDLYSFLACDSRQLACYDYVQLQSFSQALSHDQIGMYAFSRIAGSLPFWVAGTFQVNILPQLMLTPPNGIAQVYFIRWQHPQVGNMFTFMQVTVLSYFSSSLGGNTSASWNSYTAPEGEFIALWENVFHPMYLSSTYTIPKDGTAQDRDGDGYPDDTDRFPDDPLQH